MNLEKVPEVSIYIPRRLSRNLSLKRQFNGIDNNICDGIFLPKSKFKTKPKIGILSAVNILIVSILGKVE